MFQFFSFKFQWAGSEGCGRESRTAVGSGVGCWFRIPGIYPCVPSIPVKNQKKLLYFLVWNLNWNWNWDWSWNDFRECEKLYGCLCILYCTYRAGLRTLHRYGTKYTNLPRVFDIISSHSNFNPNSNSKLNSKMKNKKVFFLFFVGLHLAANIPNNVSLSGSPYSSKFGM